jgi:hypothetical protein
MKTPVRYSRGRLQYTGSIARAPFDAWAASDDGRAVVERAASGLPFALFGRTRAARRRLWRELTQAVRTEDVAGAVQHEIDGYLARLETLAYAEDLPRVGVDLHRLVVVPRMFVNAEAYRRIDAALRAQPAIVALEGAEALRRWFALALVDAAASAVAAARPSSGHPLPAGDHWIAIGVNERFEWRIPYDGPEWHGHYFVFELTRAPITRSVRKAADEAVARLEQSLQSLTRVRRTDILRQAASSLDRLFARA